MKLFRCTVALATLISMFSCSKPQTRQVVVMGRGKLTVVDNNIEMKDGTGYAEEKINLEGAEPAKLSVTTPTGKTEVTIPGEKGVYILNLKTDTIVGSRQLIGVNLSNSKVITQEEIKVTIDSLQKLILGQNIAPGGVSNFFILPGQVAKISANNKARIFGPFTLISRSIDAEEDKSVPEIYKFYTNTEMRQQIQKLIKTTTSAD